MQIRQVMSLITVLLVASIFLLPCQPAAGDYTYADNVRDAMSAGINHLEKGRLADAEIDFENVLLIEPGHVGARSRLLDAYILGEKKALAQKTFQKLRRDRVLDKKAEAAFERRIAAMTGVAPPRPTPVPTSTEKPTTITVRPPTVVATVKPPTVKPRKSVKDMSPKEKFDYAIAFKRRVDRARQKRQVVDKKALSRAIMLYVQAIQENPGLLGQDDAGLLELSRRHYHRRLKEDPDNPQVHFFVAYFHDIFSEHEQAKAEYETVARLAPEGSRMKRVALSKVETLKIQIARAKEAAAAAERAREAEKVKAALDKIRRGEAADVSDAAEYARKGKALYAAWAKKKSKDTLEEAAAWLEGAVRLKSDDADFHYTLALVLIEKATAGDRVAQTNARGHLEKTLALSPPDEMKKSAEALMKSLAVGPKKRSEAEKRYQRRNPKP